jgi:hypothetical protein
MNIVLQFFIAILPPVISVTFLNINKNKLDIIFTKYDAKYVNKKKSNIPLRRVVGMFKLYNSLDTVEKNLIIWSFIFILIFYLSFISWSLIILFFPEIFFSS